MTSGDFIFIARMEEKKAPETCKWFLEQLPFEAPMIQVAWSGAALMTDLHNTGRNVPFENATSYPLPGQVVMYPGDKKGNTGEFYLPYGGNRFACPRGQLAGNCFLMIEEGADQLEEYGKKVRWEGAQQLLFEKI